MGLEGWRVIAVDDRHWLMAKPPINDVSNTAYCRGMERAMRNAPFGFYPGDWFAFLKSMGGVQRKPATSLTKANGAIVPSRYPGISKPY